MHEPPPTATNPPHSPVAATRASVISSTRWTPSCWRSQPSSSTAPAPNLIGGAPQVKTVSVLSSTMSAPLPTGVTLRSRSLAVKCHICSGVLHSSFQVGEFSTRPVEDAPVAWRVPAGAATNLAMGTDVRRGTALEQLPANTPGYRRVLRLHAIVLAPDGPEGTAVCGYEPEPDELRDDRDWESVT